MPLRCVFHLMIRLSFILFRDSDHRSLLLYRIKFHNETGGSTNFCQEKKFTLKKTICNRTKISELICSSFYILQRLIKITFHTASLVILNSVKNYVVLFSFIIIFFQITYFFIIITSSGVVLICPYNSYSLR